MSSCLFSTHTAGKKQSFAVLSVTKKSGLDGLFATRGRFASITKLVISWYPEHID